jgi:4-amino-4-deoxy-L-arabinose transferase-like glycosyltransferase
MSEVPRRSFLWPVRLPGSDRWQVLDRVRLGRLRLGATFAIVAGVNLVLLAAYLWSRGGQSTHVSIEANGDHYVAQVDGKLYFNAQIAGPQQGGIAIFFSSTESIPSLPEPRGLDSVKVTDAASGQTLFEDDFSKGISADWTVAGAPLLRDGVVGTKGDLSLTLVRPWTNYIVQATFRNFQGGTVIVHAASSRDGVSYTFRPYRDYDDNIALLQHGERSQTKLGAPLELSRTEGLKSLVSMTLHFYPYALLALVAGLVVVLVLQLASTFAPRPDTSGLSFDYIGTAFVGGLALFGFIVTLFLNYSYGSHMPHVPDELSYLFQAKLLSMGQITAPAPPVEKAFDYFYPPFITVTNGHWAGVYPFGHPLVLMVGEWIHAIWLIPPIIGALSVVLLFLTGQKVYSARVGALAAFLFVASPFYLMTASNFMSHNTAAFYLLGVLACIAYAERKPLLLGALGGLAFGLLFNTQPLTAVVLIPPVGLLILSEFFPKERARFGRQFLAMFIAAGLVMLAAYFIYNFATTGDALKSNLSATSGKYLGFGGNENSVARGIANQQLQMSFLLLVLNGWPLLIGLAFIVLPFILGTRHRWDWFLLIAVVSAMGVYVLYVGAGIMHGPRYWYVISPLLMLLSARGAERAGEALSGVAGSIRGAIMPSKTVGVWAGLLVAYVFIVALAGSSAYGWLLGRNDSWTDLFVPAKASDLKGFNFIDDRLTKLVDNAHLHNALVLVADDCEGWQCYGSVFWLNEPALNGDVVYAKDVADKRADLLKAYPNRLVYSARYGPPASLTVYGSTEPLASASATPPLAHDIVLPTPTPTATPDPAEALRRDDQRERDLGTLAQALQDYYGKHGAYPRADGVQSFCRYKDLDAGCALSEVLGSLPQDPNNGQTYYYWSDAQSFYIFAVTETPAPLSQCDTAPLKPPSIAADLRGSRETHLYCVYGSSVPGATPPPLPTPTPTAAPP